MKKMGMILSALLFSQAAFASSYVFSVYPEGNTRTEQSMSCEASAALVRGNLSAAEVKLGLAKDSLTARSRFNVRMECDMMDHMMDHGRNYRHGYYHVRSCHQVVECAVVMMTTQSVNVDFVGFKTERHMGDDRMKACGDELVGVMKDKAIAYSKTRDYRRVLGMFGHKVCHVEGVEVLKN